MKRAFAVGMLLVLAASAAVARNEKGSACDRDVFATGLAGAWNPKDTDIP